MIFLMLKFCGSLIFSRLECWLPVGGLVMVIRWVIICHMTWATRFSWIPLKIFDWDPQAIALWLVTSCFVRSPYVVSQSISLWSRVPLMVSGWSCREVLLSTPLRMGLGIDFAYSLTDIALMGAGDNDSRILFMFAHAAYFPVAFFIASFIFAYFFSSFSISMRLLSAAHSYCVWTGLWVLVTPAVILGRRCAFGGEQLLTWLRRESRCAALSSDSCPWRKSCCLWCAV